VIAFSLVILVFMFWAVVGYGIAFAIHTRRNLLQSALLAPAAGMAATVLLAMSLSCVGLPVRYGGPAATIILVVVAASLIRRYRPVIPLRRLIPFAGALLIAALAAGYPLLRFGFNWVSYGNDDMANYCMGAKLFLNHAQFAVPSAADVVADRDPSLFYWYFYVVEGIRHGVDVMLAWLMSLTGLSAHQVFMPLILAFQLVMIAAAGSLVLQSRKLRAAALLFCCISSLSALIALGTMYQLIAQVGGLGLLAAACTVVLRPLRGRWPQMLFAGLLVSGAGAIYPEVLPFLAVSFVVYHSITLIRRAERFRSLIAGVCAIAGLSVVLLNVSMLTAIVTLAEQSKSGLTGNHSGGFLFPFFLVPAGFAYLWGFQTISQPPTGLILDIGIVAGAALLLFAVIGGIWCAWRRCPTAVVFLTILAVYVQLYRVRADFGLFKDAMFMQPFLLGTLAVVWVGICRRCRKLPVWRSMWILALLGVVGWGFCGQVSYTRRSLGDASAGLVEIPFASSEGLIEQLKALPANYGTRLSDTSNVVLVKFESWYQSPVYFPVDDFYTRVLLAHFDKFNLFHSMFGENVSKPRRERLSQFVAAYFDMHGALPSANHFQLRRSIPSTEFTLEDGARTTVLNRRSNPPSHAGLVRLVPKATERDHLIFVASEFGVPPYTGIRERAQGLVSIYQVEPDYFFHGSSMASLGRDSLFLLLNPSPRPRLVLEYSASLNSDRDNRIPAASVIGQQRQMLAATGRGSARLFSPTVEPQEFLGEGYVALDMGTWGWSFPQKRSKVMSLFGTDVMADPRKITGFARDISLISDEEYSRMKAPQAIRRFPDDLADKMLEYSGIYEDGWIAESSYAVLSHSGAGSSLVVRLLVPAIGGHGTASSLTVLVDGHEVERRALEAGLVDVRVPVSGTGKPRVELRFDRAECLPSPDGRPVSAQIRYLGFDSGGSESLER
jgi:hypothetical protein